MKKYFVAKKTVRFIVVLLVCTVLLNGFISNKYKSVYADSNIEVENLEQFLDNFSIIPQEIKEEYYGDFRLLNIPLSEDLQNYTFEMSKKYDIDYMLIMSIMYTESSFNEKVKSKNKTDNYYSIGLMQLNQRYESEFIELTGKQDFNIYDSYDNILGGIAKIYNLKELWSKYDISDEDMFLAITNSYNKGFGAYKNDVVGRGFFNRDYDKKVLENKIKLEMNGGN
jgi:hypothetical protein